MQPNCSPHILDHRMVDERRDQDLVRILTRSIKAARVRRINAGKHLMRETDGHP